MAKLLITGKRVQLLLSYDTPESEFGMNVFVSFVSVPAEIIEQALSNSMST